MDLLELAPDADGALGRRQRQEWVPLLLADAWKFEHGAQEGSHDLLPVMRPGPEIAEKRMHLLAGIISPDSRKTPEAAGAGLAVPEVANCSASARKERALLLCMQPVYVIHDEYLFIRVLRSVEVTFAAMAAEVRDAIGAVRRGDAESAVASLTTCSRTLVSARGLFTVLATMRSEAFRAFRIHTTGASAIQSGNYKTFEALCSLPAEARIQSAAYGAVPRVREHVLGQWTDLLSTIEHAVSDGTIGQHGLELIQAAAAELGRVHQMWKQTHWRLADKMIGEDRGTGYT